MTKNLILGPILAHLVQIWVPNFFLQVLPLLVIRKCSKLSSYAIYRKTNEPNLRKWQKNLILDPILACLTPIWAPNFFWQVSPLIVVRHCSKLSSYAIQGNLTKHTRENGKKNWFWPVLCPTLVRKKNCRKLSLYVISRKTDESNLKKNGKKTSFWATFAPQKIF